MNCSIFHSDSKKKGENSTTLSRHKDNSFYVNATMKKHTYTQGHSIPTHLGPPSSCRGFSWGKIIIFIYYIHITSPNTFKVMNFLSLALCIKFCHISRLWNRIVTVIKLIMGQSFFSRAKDNVRFVFIRLHLLVLSKDVRPQLIYSTSA